MNAMVRRLWPAAMISRVTSLEPVRYLVASVAALLVDLGTFSACMRIFSMGWAAAALIGFALGAAVAYWASINWVFNERTHRARPGREFATFVLIGALGLLVTQAALWLLIEKLHFQAELSRILAAGATFVFNYTVRTFTLFRTQKALQASS